jgi:large subunit ribosomal protein L29
MKAAEIKGMTGEQLAAALSDTEKHLFKLRFQSATDRLETPSEIRKAKRDIARLQTESRARELKAESGLNDADLAKALEQAAMGQKADGAMFPGVRQPRRAAERIEKIQTTRLRAARKAALAAKPAPAGKGK